MASILSRPPTPSRAPRFPYTALSLSDPDILAPLHWAQEFARLNREVMMDRLNEQLGRFLDGEVQRVEEVNCHHNYTAVETHFGEQRVVSRKGAIAAHKGLRGLIPGSLGTRSYVV